MIRETNKTEIIKNHVFYRYFRIIFIYSLKTVYFIVIYIVKPVWDPSNHWFGVSLYYGGSAMSFCSLWEFFCKTNFIEEIVMKLRICLEKFFFEVGFDHKWNLFFWNLQSFANVSVGMILSLMTWREGCKWSLFPFAKVLNL